MFSKLLKQIIQRKLITTIILLLIIAGGYFGYTAIFSNEDVVRYATAQVQKGTLIVSISGSGQVSATTQVDIKPKASGEVIYVGVKNNEVVKAGTLIAQLDARDVRKALRDAELNLANVELALTKLRRAATVTKTETDIAKSYESAFNLVADIFHDLPEMIGQLNDIFLESSYQTVGEPLADIDYYMYVGGSSETWSRPNEAAYLKVRRLYEQVLEEYRVLDRTSSPAEIERALSTTYTMMEPLGELVRGARDITRAYLDTLKNESLIPPFPEQTTTEQLTALSEYTTTLNNHLVALLGVQ